MPYKDPARVDAWRRSRIEYWRTHNPWGELAAAGIVMRLCRKCNRMRGIEEFARNNATLSGLHSYCQKCVSDATRQERKFNINNRWARDRYYQLVRRGRSLGFEDCISQSDFFLWYSEALKQCAYCDIPAEVIPQISWGTQKNVILTIDRADNMMGYVAGNIRLSCAVCNTAKGKIFTETEFRELAQKYIKPKWVGRI